jgi:hypothetical protein
MKADLIEVIGVMQKSIKDLSLVSLLSIINSFIKYRTLMEIMLYRLSFVFLRLQLTQKILTVKAQNSMNSILSSFSTLAWSIALKSVLISTVVVLCKDA